MREEGVYHHTKKNNLSLKCLSFSLSIRKSNREENKKKSLRFKSNRARS